MKKIITIITTLIFGLAIVWVVNAALIDQSGWEVRSTPVFDGTNKAYYPSVLKIDGTYHMWYTDKDSGGAYVIGYATSDDGLTWSNPTMATGLTGEPSHVVVVNVGTEGLPHYRMWYSDGSRWPYNDDSFRTAESTDGINWVNDQQIGQDPNARLVSVNEATDPAYKWVYGSYGPGAVFYKPDGYAVINETDPMGNKYVMYYDQYTKYWLTGVNEVTMLAISVDGINWKRYGNTPVLNAVGGLTMWDAQYVYVWTVLKLEDGYHMWYSGGISDSNDGIGYAYSDDGITWIKDTENPVLHTNDGDAQVWRQVRTYTPMVLLDCDNLEWKMYFSAMKGTTGYNEYVIGIATMPADPTLCLPPTKAEVLKESGVPGKGLDQAPGLQKPFNQKSKAVEQAGKK